MNLSVAEQLATILMKKHGLSNWTFKWTRAQTSFGHCDYGKRVIALSSFLTNIVDEAHVRETILHEIAHAFTPGDHHGMDWVEKCREIGGVGKRTSDIEITDIQRPPKWIMKYKDEIIHRWYRKPNKNTFTRIGETWIKGRKKETYGKCRIEEFKR